MRLPNGGTVRLQPTFPIFPRTAPQALVHGRPNLVGSNHEDILAQALPANKVAHVAYTELQDDDTRAKIGDFWVENKTMMECGASHSAPIGARHLRRARRPQTK